MSMTEARPRVDLVPDGYHGRGIVMTSRRPFTEAHLAISETPSTRVGMTNTFLDSARGREWDSERTGAATNFYIGEGSSSLEIVVTETDDRPTKGFLQNPFVQSLRRRTGDDRDLIQGAHRRTLLIKARRIILPRNFCRSPDGGDFVRRFFMAG